MDLTAPLVDLLLTDDPAVQDQGWALLSSLPVLTATEVQRAMSEALWAQVSAAQARSHRRLLDPAGAMLFARRYFALRALCDRWGCPWSCAEIRVDGGIRSPLSREPVQTSVIEYRLGRYTVGRASTRDFPGGFARLRLPAGHPLRQRPEDTAAWGEFRLAGIFFYLSPAAARLEGYHPALDSGGAIGPGRWTSSSRS